MARPLSLLAFGACLLHGPLDPLDREKTRMVYSYGPLSGTYTFGEIFQAIDILQGKKTIPDALQLYCNKRPSIQAVPRSVNFEGVDVVLVEPSSPIDLTYRGFSVNRTSMAQLFQPIRAVGREASKHWNIWLRKGLIGQDEEARVHAAERFANFVPNDMENADLARSIILETVPSKPDIAASLLRLQNIIRRPMGVVVYIFQYLADGRAVSWPSGFHEAVLSAAAAADLPVFEPSLLVKEYGVETSLHSDLRHYSENFLPVMAEALLQFSHAVVARATPEVSSLTGC